MTMSSEALAATRLGVRHAGSQLGRLGVVAPAGDSIPSPDSDLEVRLELPLPGGMRANSETAFFVYGSCFHHRLRVRKIELLTGSEATPVTYGMPRADLHTAVHQLDGARPREA